MTDAPEVLASQIGARLDAALDAARESGELLMRHLGRVDHVVAKSTSVDLVTEVDIASGRAVLGRLLAAFPDDGAVTEEPSSLEGLKPVPASDARFVWVVDPLDGTTSYVHTFPYFCVSIALLLDGRPVAGVIYAPIDDELFAAAADGPATLNGRPIAVSGRGDLSQALLVTGFSYDRTWPLERQIRMQYAFLKRVQGLRRNGAAALDLCYVAAGRADGYWELEMKDWDLAAGAVILRAAGGRITGFDGVDWSPGETDVVASNGPLHEAMLEVVREADPGREPKELPSL
jgi:myo-inositol-1(or 4)-monophosphatase